MKLIQKVYRKQARTTNVVKKAVGILSVYSHCVVYFFVLTVRILMTSLGIHSRVFGFFNKREIFRL